MPAVKLRAGDHDADLAPRCYESLADGSSRAMNEQIEISMSCILLRLSSEAASGERQIRVAGDDANLVRRDVQKLHIHRGVFRAASRTY